MTTGGLVAARLANGDASGRKPSPGAGRPARRRVGRRKTWLLGSIGAVVVSALLLVDGQDGLVNPGGWTLFARFWSAAATPELSGDFLLLTARAALTTIAYAVLGTAASTCIGLIGALALSESWWRREAVGVRRSSPTQASLRWGWYLQRGIWAIPRGIHEAVWGLLFLSILGRDPLVAVLAIAVPFGAITAKVYAELIDEQRSDASEVLRASGAGRLTSLAYGTLPGATSDLVSYGFYRLECSIRSAVVLGIVGAGGLGFELALSFQSLHYAEMWTLIYALVVISGLADAWSALLRGGRRSPMLIRSSLATAAILIVLAAVLLGIDVTTLWSDRAVAMVGRLAGDVWPPRLPAGGFTELLGSAIQTLEMSIVASALATALAVGAAFLAARSAGGPLSRTTGLGARALLLFCRAIPPPVWAFVLLLVLLPGGVPGAVALGLYNFGILGRLLAEVVENHDRRPSLALHASGADPATAFVYGVLPHVSPRFVAYSLYRWEVTMRETVVVGLVGAGGLGRLLAEQHVAFDYGGMLVTATTLVVLTLAVDMASARMRRGLR